MEKRFNDIKGPFADYRQKVDNLFITKTLNYNALFDEILPNNNSSGFYRTVFSIIESFLNDNDSKQLFIQAPCEELGRNETDRNHYFSLLQNVAAEVLCLATVDSLNKKVGQKSIENSEIGTLYCIGTKVPNPNDEKVPARERVWKVSESTNGGKYLCEQLPDKKHFTITQSAKVYKDYFKYVFRINSNLNFDETLIRRKKVFTELEKVGKKLYFYKEHSLSRQYSNALLVGYSQNWGDTILESSLLECPVLFTTRYDLINEDNDIVIFVGDKKYRYYRDLIQRKLAYNKLKKVIYIGSEIYDGYDELNGAVKYSFTFRDMFSYFNNMNGSDIGVFPYIKLNTLSFPWLKNTINNLELMLNEMNGLTRDEIRNVISYSIYPFLGISPQSHKKREPDIIKDYLYENINMSYEDVDKYVDFYSKLIYPENDNPKEKLRKKIINKHPTSSYCIIENQKSFKNIIKQFLRENNNRHNNRYIIDVKGDWYSYVEILKYLLTQGIAGHYYFLSYFQQNLIERFMRDELKVYKSPYRKRILEGLTLDIKDEDYITEDRVDGDLSSFYKPVFLDDFLNTRNNNRIRNSLQFRLIDENNNIYDTGGNVIFGSEQVSLQDIYDNKEDYLPANITFYDKPDNFQLLMKLKYSFPPDRDVNYYAQLWKDRLKDYCQRVYNGDLKKMREEAFPFIKNLRRYFNENDTTKFPNQIHPLVRKLLALGIINKEESRLIVCANNANRQNSNNGIELKEALYEYNLSCIKKKILEDIENAANNNGYILNADTIKESSLKTVFVYDIIKLNN